MKAGPPNGLLARATRHFFFTGKGGVGKTSLACAVAVALADRGRRVLLVSTDPASNLDEVLATPLDRNPRPIAGAKGLEALNINPQAAAQAYREKIVSPWRGQLPAAALRSMEEQLSGACTMEIAAFDEFARLLGDPSATAAYDHVIFDTAPTGHTLRLMLLPRAWTRFLDANTTGSSCLGPLAGLDAQRTVYESAMRTLSAPGQTTIVLVSRAQLPALREAQRTAEELRGVGITHLVQVLNGLFHATKEGDPTAEALEAREGQALAAFSGFLDSCPTYAVPLRPHNLLGLEALRALLADGTPFLAPPSGDAPLPAFAPPPEFLAELTGTGPGVIMTMGKGGVGKTTIAAGLALALAKAGHRVHLTTTDPAAHLAAALDETPPLLTVGRIDPALETQRYVADVMASQGATLDAPSRALLEEDLRSPCTEEIAVFRAFARTVAEGRDGYVVLDTAPTGHTLLLLDATQAYHRELGRQARASVPEDVRELLPRLRDPTFTRVLLVTLPEATPVHEAAALQADLRRAGIEPFGWIINQSFALTPTSDPLLVERARREHAYFHEVARTHTRRMTALPWQAVAPVGTAALARLFSPPARTMPIYVYETIPQTTAESPGYFQVQQGPLEAPLTRHPESGKPVRRVVLGGYGILKSEPAAPANQNRCDCGPDGCCR
jgi:arsenite-transporting ATPase